MPIFNLLDSSGNWSPFVGHLSRATLSSAWRELQLATEDSFNNEATKFVELQAENDALKAAMRRFKLQAQNYAKKLKAVTPASEIFIRNSADSLSYDMTTSFCSDQGILKQSCVKWAHLHSLLDAVREVLQSILYGVQLHFTTTAFIFDLSSLSYTSVPI